MIKTRRQNLYKGSFKRDIILQVGLWKLSHSWFVHGVYLVRRIGVHAMCNTGDNQESGTL